MKKILILSALVFTAVTAAVAQTRTWSQDFDKALATAKKTNRVVLVDFSGTDWCPWCIKLDKEVFSQKTFRNYAKKNLVTVLIDFPRKKKQAEEIKLRNEKLAKQYEVDGFPTVILINAKGETIATTGYQEGGAKAYVAHLQELIAKAGK
jgi:protein disulfide-isomerase